MTGALLARAHAHSADPRTDRGVLRQERANWTRRMAAFAVAYADRTEADHAELLAAVRAGRVRGGVRGCGGRGRGAPPSAPGGRAGPGSGLRPCASGRTQPGARHVARTGPTLSGDDRLGTESEQRPVRPRRVPVRGTAGNRRATGCRAGTHRVSRSPWRPSGSRSRTSRGCTEQRLGPMYARLDELDGADRRRPGRPVAATPDGHARADEARALRRCRCPGSRSCSNELMDGDGLFPRPPRCSRNRPYACRGGSGLARRPGGSTASWPARPTPTWRRTTRTSGAARARSSPGSTPPTARGDEATLREPWPRSGGRGPVPRADARAAARSSYARLEWLDRRKRAARPARRGAGGERDRRHAAGWPPTTPTGCSTRSPSSRRTQRPAAGGGR